MRLLTFLLVIFTLTISNDFFIEATHRHSRGIGFIKDMRMVFDDLKGSTLLKKKAMIDAITAVSNAKLGLLDNIKEANTHILKSIDDAKVAKTEAVKAGKIAFLQTLGSRIIFPSDSMTNDDDFSDRIERVLQNADTSRNYEKIMLDPKLSEDIERMMENAEMSREMDKMMGKGKLSESIEKILQDPKLSEHIDKMMENPEVSRYVDKIMRSPEMAEDIGKMMKNPEILDLFEKMMNGEPFDEEEKKYSSLRKNGMSSGQRNDPLMDMLTGTLMKLPEMKKEEKENEMETEEEEDTMNSLSGEEMSMDEDGEMYMPMFSKRSPSVYHPEQIDMDSSSLER